jgi:hypothetical protein
MADASRFPQGIIIQLDISAVASPVSTIVRDTTTGELYVSNNASTPSYVQLTNTGSGATVFGAYRLKQADMPAGLSTGVTFFGNTFVPNTPHWGCLVLNNSAPDVGASGITQLNLFVGVANLGFTKQDIMLNSLNIVGSSAGYQDVLNNSTEYISGVHSIDETHRPYTTLTAVGANLDQLVTLDTTVIVYSASSAPTLPA